MRFSIKNKWLGENVGRDMLVEGLSGEDLEGKEESCRESGYCLRVYILHCEQKVARNSNVKGTAGQVSERSEALSVETGEKVILVTMTGLGWSAFC